MLIFRPLSMSENLSRLAQKIDFIGKDGEGTVGNKTASAAGESLEDKEDNATDQQIFKTTPAWPWESVRTKLQCVIKFLNSIESYKTVLNFT